MSLLPELYILTDARGYTVAAATRDQADRECTRIPLHAPITVFHWKLIRSNPNSDRAQTRLHNTFLWDGVSKPQW